jgi:hypothetical protein
MDTDTGMYINTDRVMNMDRDTARDADRDKVEDILDEQRPRQGQGHGHS